MKVLFDALCRAVERNESLAGLRPFLQKCHVFHLDIVPHEGLVKYMDEIKIEDHVDDFFLPFPVVAVEDRASVLMAADLEENQRGFGGKRIFFEYIDASHERAGAFFDGKKLRDSEFDSKDFNDTAIVSMTIVDQFNMQRDDQGRLRTGIRGLLDRMWYLKSDIVQFSVDPQQFGAEECQKLSEAGGKNCITCIEELMVVNNPSRFIVERRPIKLRSGHGKNGRIPRTNERSIYTILEPWKIRERLGLPEPREGGSRQPHSVRRHFRSYRSDRWVNVKGKRVVIEAFWVGPSEADVGAHHYKVLLDK